MLRDAKPPLHGGGQRVRVHKRVRHGARLSVKMRQLHEQPGKGVEHGDEHRIGVDRADHDPRAGPQRVAKQHRCADAAHLTLSNERGGPIGTLAHDELILRKRRVLLVARPHDLRRRPVAGVEHQQALHLRQTSRKAHALEQLVAQVRVQALSSDSIAHEIVPGRWQLVTRQQLLQRHRVARARGFGAFRPFLLLGARRVVQIVEAQNADRRFPQHKVKSIGELVAAWVRRLWIYLEAMQHNHRIHDDNVADGWIARFGDRVGELFGHVVFEPSGKPHNGRSRREGGAKNDRSTTRFFGIGTTAEAAAYFAIVARAIKMANDQRTIKSRIVLHEPIALLAAGCVLFVLCWIFY